MAEMIHKREGRYQPAVLKCDRGEEVILEDPLDNTCERCEANYNMFGQRVLHSRDPNVEERYYEDY